MALVFEIKISKAYTCICEEMERRNCVNICILIVDNIVGLTNNYLS